MQQNKKIKAIKKEDINIKQSKTKIFVYQNPPPPKKNTPKNRIVDLHTSTIIITGKGWDEIHVEMLSMGVTSFSPTLIKKIFTFGTYNII